MRLKEVISKIKHFRLELKYFATAHRSFVAVCSWTAADAQCDKLAWVENSILRRATFDRRSCYAVAPPGFCNRGEVRYGSIGGLEYEVPQSRLYCLCINLALCSTALQCICRVMRSSSMTMKAHTYYIIFGRPPIRGGASPLSTWRRHCCHAVRHSERPAQCTHGMMRRAGPSATAGTC